MRRQPQDPTSERPPSARTEGERRLGAQYETTRVLAESSSLAEATPSILQAICESLGWEHGALWRVDEQAGELRCVETWNPPEVSFPEFDALSRRTAFPPGIGLPGRVWASGEPAWIPDVVHDANFPRAPVAAREGLHGAFGFPILLGSEILGVLEFFSREIREPDEDLLRMMGTIGGQIGQFIERKQAEAELDRFFSAALDMLCIAGFDGYFKRLNPAWETNLGFTRQELLARPYLEFVHPDDRASTLAEADKISAGATTISFENRYLCKDGSYKWLLWNASPSVEQRVIYAAARDVTARKQAEEELWRYTRELEAARHTQAESAARLARLVKELAAAKARAEQADRAKGDFLANVSHEIRTPMNAVVGMTQLALQTKLTAEQRLYLNAVKDAADSLMALINDILDFSKIEARKLELDRIEFDLRDTLEDTLRMLAVRAEEKGLELACRIHPDVPDRIVGDPGRLRQILVNLVGNAIKFTERGEVVLHVETVSRTDEEVWLRLAVADTGIGIPEADRRRIFGAFEQVDASTTRRYGGTGLGLAICSQIVKLMGGELGLESELGRGSTFHFTAPFAIGQGASKTWRRRLPANLREQRVLVVDDNDTNRVILETSLRSWGMTPVTAPGAPEALALLSQASNAGRPFPLVLLDGHMPVMDGFMLATRIRHDSSLTDTAIIMLTSAGRPDDLARCRKLRLAGYLTKPVKQSDLLELIVKGLGERVRREARILAADRGSDRASSAAPEQATPAGQAGAELSGAAPAGASPAASAGASREASTGGPRGERRRLRILLAEDNAVNREVAIHLIEKRGHTVVAAGNGREALATLENPGAGGAFDLVLMDVQMPEMGGFEATEAIRRKEGVTGGHIPIVAMTAHAMTGDRERCLQAGMDGYVAKPIQSDVLWRTIEEVVADRAGGESPAGGGGPAEGGKGPAGGGEGLAGGGEGAVLDTSALLERMGGDIRLIRKVARLFLDDCPGMMSRIQRAVSLRDPGVLQEEAHRLKGSVANFVAPRAVAAAARLEAMGREGDLSGAEEAYRNLQEEIGHLEAALEELGVPGRGKQPRSGSRGRTGTEGRREP